MENKRAIQEIFEKAGYSDIAKKTNRSRDIRGINHVLNNSNINIWIADLGMQKITPKGFKYNIRIELGALTVKYNNGTPSSYGVLAALANFLQNDKVKGKLSFSVELEETCSKCNGAGIIPQFMHYANGVCFDCLGFGKVEKYAINKPTKAKTGRAFLNQFYIAENYDNSFPCGVDKIKAIDFINHETATYFLGVKDDHYYIYQPICMANSWYKIPKENFDKFSKYWNETRKCASVKLEL